MILQERLAGAIGIAAESTEEHVKIVKASCAGYGGTTVKPET
jgi:hypothetical protein